MSGVKLSMCTISVFILDPVVITGGESDYHGHSVEDDGDHGDEGQDDEHQDASPGYQDSR